MLRRADPGGAGLVGLTAAGTLHLHRLYTRPSARPTQQRHSAGTSTFYLCNAYRYHFTRILWFGEWRTNTFRLRRQRRKDPCGFLLSTTVTASIVHNDNFFGSTEVVQPCHGSCDTAEKRGHSPTDKSQDKVLPIEVCYQPPGFGMEDLAMLFGESFHAESFAQDHESSPGLRLERAGVNYEFPSPLFLQPQPAYRCSIKIGGCPPCIFVSGINSNLQDYCYLTFISGTRRLTMTWPVELASKQQLLTSDPL